MTNHQLLDMIGDAKGEFLLEAQRHREGRPKVGHLNTKKIWLIAAIVALMLLLVGCVAVILGLQDLSVGTFFVDAGFGETVPREVISLQGYTGSPGYQATREWLEFTKNYDQDKTLIHRSSYDDFVEPEEYRMYNCYTQEMVDKVNEILEKYDLKMPQKLYLGVESEELFQAVGIRSIFAENTPAEQSLYSGYHYDDGAFNISGETTFTRENAPWGCPVSYQYEYVCMMKDTFYDIYGTINDIDSYTQWQHVTPDGTEVLLALEIDHARIIADKETCFVSVNVLDIVAEDGVLEMSAEAMEAFADSFDFSFTPHAVDREAADRREAEREAALEDQRKANSMICNDYGVYMAGAMYPAPDARYSLVDFGGDGVEELAYWTNGGYQYLFTKIDGCVEEVEWFAFPFGYEVCRMDTGEYVLKSVRIEYGIEYTAFFTLDGTQPYYTDFLKFDPAEDPDNPWYICTNAPGQEYSQFMETPMYWEQVTTEEYFAVYDRYAHQEPDRKPVSQLLEEEPSEPVMPEIENGTPTMQQAIDGGLEEILAYYRKNFPDEEIYYTLHDFDDDGYADVGIWQDGLFHALHMLNENGQAKHCWGVAGGFRVCETYYQMAQQVGYEHNILYVYTSYSYEDIDAQVENHTFLWSMADGVSVREQLQHDPTFDGCEWGRSLENNWTNLTTWTPITESEYNDAIAAYREMKFDLKPITEYP